MTAIGIVALQTCACLGLGVGVLRILGIQKELPTVELITWSFAIGFGLLGWALYFVGLAGWFSTAPLITVLCVSACGVYFLSPQFLPPPNTIKIPLDVWCWLIIAALLVVAVFDLFEGLSPPADGDTLAYHFVHPKNFLAAGALSFVPRGGDGAIPMIVHMTYVPALHLGSERALTLWTMLSGWAAVALLYSIARRFLSQRWSFMLALIFMTTPAVIYGAGSGQVEIRISLFVMVAALSTSLALKTGLLRYTVLAGIAAGFFMGSKFLGLLFVVTCGLVILAQRRWLVHGLVFSVVALTAGSQWYIWNYIHTGDPVFPVLFEFLKQVNYSHWDQAHNDAFKLIWVQEKSVPANLLWFLGYPFAASFSAFKTMESGRTGMGPFLLLIFPFVVAALWKFRTQIRQSFLLPIAGIVLIFYALWFFTGSSQRVRHLLPIYPLLLVCASAVALRWASEAYYLKPLLAAMILTIPLQISVQVIFGLNYAHHIFTDENRNAFLLRTVSGFTPIPWINQNLSSKDRLYTQARHLNYLFTIPIHYGHWAADAKIDTRPFLMKNHAKLLQQFKIQGVTHLLVSGPMKAQQKDTSSRAGYGLWRTLLDKGCLQPTKSFTGLTFGSRTLRLNQSNKSQFHVLKLKSTNCIL